MITSFTVKNFRQHLNTTINLNADFNIIQGENLAGKTNLFRALRALLFCLPLSERDLPRNTNQTSIEISCLFDNGDTLYRKYIKGKNLYRFTTNGVTSEYTSVALAQEAIPRLTGFNFLQFKTKKLNVNFYEARDSLLLVHNTATELYNIFSSLLGFECLSLNISKTKTEIKTSQKSTETLKAEIHSKKFDIREVQSEFNSVDSKLSSLLKIKDTHNLLQQQIEDLTSFCTSIKNKISTRAWKVSVEISLLENFLLTVYSSQLESKREDEPKEVTVPIYTFDNICPTCKRPL